ncbi:MAG: transglycosylase domain-containing protein, partial [Clostridia bacterium]|nr:transglycosylase domain-containing protein [Clostridia bacterium]
MSGRTKKKKRRVNKKQTTRRPVQRTTNNSGPIRKPVRNKKNKPEGNKGGRKKHAKLIKALLITAIVILLAILIALGVFAGIFFSDKFALTREDLLIGTSNTMIYDSEGNLIAELSGKENRKIVSIDEMSPYLPKAFVAIEDERFY